MQLTLAGMDHGFGDVNIWGAAGVAQAVGIPATYFGLCALYKSIGWWDGMKTKKGEHVRNVIAYEFTFGVFCSWFFYYGLVLYYQLHGVDDLYTEPLLSNPYYGRSVNVVQNILYPMMWYQIWNLFFTFWIKDLFVLEQVAHHILTGAIQYIGFPGFLNYHAYFFIGIVEMSNIPLAIVDLTRYDPDFEKRWPKLYSAMRIFFVLGFVVTRNILWPLIATPCMIDLYNTIQEGKAHSVFVVCAFMFATTCLTYLQLVWGYKIIRMSLGHFFGFGRKKVKKVA